MKIIYIFLFISLLITSLFSQEVIQKQIFDYRTITNIDSNKHQYWGWINFSYYRNKETYVCMKQDSANGKKYIIYSNKGNSRGYDALNYLIFDSLGNYYMVASDSVSGSKVNRYLLKNGMEFLKYNEIYLMYERKRLIYFSTMQNDYLSTIHCYNPFENRLNDFKPYYRDSELFFTKDDKSFFFARTNSDFSSEKFLVFDGVEQKHYSDINYDYKTDKDGYPVYVAKDKGNFYPLYDEDNLSSGQFVVYNNREYKKFENIQLTKYFTDSGQPVYCAKDFGSDNNERIMFGNAPASKLYHNINEITITKDNKLVFIAGDYNYSFTVYDGIESKKFGRIEDLKVYPDGLLYISEDFITREKYIIFNLNEIKTGMFNIIDFNILPNGELEYSGRCSKYDSLTKKYSIESYIQMGDRIIGKGGFDARFDFYHSVVKTDSNGNYCFIIYRQPDYNVESRQVLYSNLGESSDFSWIFEVGFYKGKIFYRASDESDKYFFNNNRLYYDFKPISDEFDDIQNFNFDQPSGIITFVGLKDYVFYDVEIKL